SDVHEPKLSAAANVQMYTSRNFPRQPMFRCTRAETFRGGQCHPAQSVFVAGWEWFIAGALLFL
ncbi:hypothetical protein, partial [uncultured Fibrobacter sp.]|uniref:hypothetical protein n=1 Tax=uncultured Fibrobacter sp. TaxID=261512 RepID=UPI002592E0D4